jgi:methylthioribose-1-phosphate isomerase
VSSSRDIVITCLAYIGTGAYVKVSINGKESNIRAVWFDHGEVRIIDQRDLPYKLTVISLKDHVDVAESIRNMTTRGAPSIGATAAYGMCLAALNKKDINDAARTIKNARPTAHDLFYAVDHMLTALGGGEDPIEAADAYAQMIVDKCTMIGEHGSKLIRNGDTIMTHCNAGALATVDVGTALAPIRKAWADGKDIFVYASETRPRLQGMQLTSWELLQEGIPHCVIADGASGHFMRGNAKHGIKGVDMIITGADRITANGDLANKIGTYEKAVIAKELGIPFYVAAPISTFDFETECGEDIVIEDRSEEEVTMIGDKRIAPAGSRAKNPSFDMTPARYVTAFITEVGVLKPNEISKLR